jgi:hypothetical protein
VARNADSPAQAAFTERLSELRAQATASIRQPTAEAHAAGSHSVDLLNGELGFTSERLLLRWNSRPCHANWVTRPALRQERPQAHRSPTMLVGGEVPVMLTRTGNRTKLRGTLQACNQWS